MRFIILASSVFYFSYQFLAMWNTFPIIARSHLASFEITKISRIHPTVRVVLSALFTNLSLWVFFFLSFVFKHQVPVYICNFVSILDGHVKQSPQHIEDDSACSRHHVSNGKISIMCLVSELIFISFNFLTLI